MSNELKQSSRRKQQWSVLIGYTDIFLATPRNSKKNVRLPGLWADTATQDVPSMKGEGQLISTSRVSTGVNKDGQKGNQDIRVSLLNIYFMPKTRFLPCTFSGKYSTTSNSIKISLCKNVC